MAFPLTPINGQEFSNKVYDSTVGAWIDSNISNAAIGGWNTYIPVETNKGTATYEGEWRWRRVGDAMEIFAELNTITAGDATGLYTFSLPSGFTMSHATGTWSVRSGNIFIGSVGRKDSTTFYVYMSGDAYRSNSLFQNPASGSQVWVSVKATINQWSSNINLASDFTEYASNSNTASLNDETAFAYGVEGSPFPNIVFGSGVTRNIKWAKSRQATDIMLIEFYNPSAKVWEDAEKKYPYTKIWSPSNGVAFSVGVTKSPIGINDEFIQFGSGGLNLGTNPNGGAPLGDVASSQSWAALYAAGWRWRVRKVSNGNMAETRNDFITATGGERIKRKVFKGILPAASATTSVALGGIDPSKVVTINGSFYLSTYRTRAFYAMDNDEVGRAFVTAHIDIATSSLVISSGTNLIAGYVGCPFTAIIEYIE